MRTRPHAAKVMTVENDGWFRKGHALGNDYLVLASPALPVPLTPARVALLCDRGHGVGGDGVIEIVSRDPASRASVVVWNADGSRAEVSGNGLRIAALALASDGGWPESGARVLHSAGRDYLVKPQPGNPGRIEITLAAARLGRLREGIAVAARTLTITTADVGNPHAVVEAGEISVADWPAYAARLECHARFPDHANIERLDILDRTTIAILIHERGVGATAASGTGAAAAAAVAVALGLVEPGAIRVCMPGGEVQVDSRPDSLTLSGPVELNFEGRLSPELLRRISAS